ncbi:hypothetical protein KP509_02G017700 [Ceratopteris richardii]|uniref:Uncharacterized protein n=3 Tax=Ceratopteris richardii TaxID=49495 RepID=A0A8T2V3P0_CERRI|nr:hypothetical protein KP509_02G017700 [Ceratopteris richardii]
MLPCPSLNSTGVPSPASGLALLPSIRPRLPTVARRIPALICCSKAGQDEVLAKEGSALTGSIFGGEKELSGLHQVLQGLSAPARYATSVAIVAGALAAGYALGTSAKGTRTAAIGGAVALGAAGGATAYVLNSAAPTIAAAHLHNAVAKLEDPTSLKSEEVDAIVRKFGVSKQDEPLNSELKDLYDRFVTGVIPPGNEDLKGDEVQTIMMFKNALGLEDSDAAAVHIEIGRRIFRQRLETGDKDTAVQERRTFQKLVYVSNLVFGEASKFLLPWKRVFQLTDAQVDIAMRDNAQRLFQSQLKSLSAGLDLNQLLNLRKQQLSLKLSDEVAASSLRSCLREQIEEQLISAVDILKSRTRTRDTRRVIEELENVISYNDSLIALSTSADKSVLPPGLEPITVLGGAFDDERKMDELKQLYRVYVTEAFSTGQLEDEKVSSLAKLKRIFALGNRESEDIMLEVTSKVYRKLLAQAAVPAGELDQASSKAAFLQSLCDKLRFDPEKAKELHEEIYKQKLQQCLSDGVLSDDDAKALRRLHVLLCLPQEAIDAAHEAICGRLLEKTVDEAIGAGVDGYDADMKAAVQRSVKGLRLSRESALAIASKTVRAVFIAFVKRARGAGSRVESARELRKLVTFNVLVVTELISDIKSSFGKTMEEKAEDAVKTEEEEIEEEEDEWQELQTLRKTKPKSDDISGKKPQFDITLKDDLDLRERLDLYRIYLLFCISGESSGMPMGTQIVVKKDTNEFLRLGQLGNLLGLTSKEVADVHKGLAEQAFRQQAQVILADGQLSKVRVEQLNELQKQLGLPSESAQKVISNIVNTRMRGAIETAINSGKLSIEEVRSLREAGVDIDVMISADVREKLFKKILDGVFSSGTGDFSDEDLYEKYPKDLGLDLIQAKAMVQQVAKERVGNTLIQAVSLLRQKNLDGVVSSLNDMLACDKASSSEPLSWSVQEELSDLFCVFYKSSPPPERVNRLQYLLGLDNDRVSTLLETVDSGRFSLEEQEEFDF